MQISNEVLAIGIPLTFPYVPSSFFHSFVQLERPNFVFIHADNGPIDTLRNDIVEKALKLEVTKLIMMDADMVYHPRTIPALLGHRLPVVGAVCFRRYPPFDSIMLRVVPNEGREGMINPVSPGAQLRYEPVLDWQENELVEVDATGAGCLMFDMEVFKRLPYPWFRFQKQADTGAVIGEDVGFCQDLKAAGYRIFVDTSVPAGHLTTMVVNENTNKLYRAMKTAQAKKATAAAFGVEPEPYLGEEKAA